MEVTSEKNNEMEVIVPLKSISENINIESKPLKNCDLQVSEDSDIEVIEEKLKENDKSKILAFFEKRGKIKKTKAKLGQKRKLSGSIETNNKKFKRKKKDEKPSSGGEKEPTLENGDADELLGQSTTPGSCVQPVDSPVPEVQPSNADGKDSATKEKSKSLSSRKVKAITNACREALNVLMKFEMVSLESMDSSLKILKEHNFLDNKLLTMDTLMDLIGLAIESNKASIELDAEKDVGFCKIVSNLTISKTPKSSRGRASLTSGDSPNKTKAQVTQDGTTGSGLAPISSEVDVQSDSTVQQENTGKTAEEVEMTADVPEVILDQTNSTEKPGKNFITNYFKKLERTIEERDKNERFSLFMTKTDMSLAPKFGGELTDTRRQKLEEELENQTCEINYLAKNTPRLSSKSMEGQRIISEKSMEKAEGVDGTAVAPSNTGTTLKLTEDKGNKHPSAISVPACSKTKAKLLQFHDNRRPPYWGTWRRKSDEVRPKNPFGKDKMLNYEIDSDDEWEGEEEPGESLHGSDDEKEPEEDYEVDNDFFVPHGYLSDDENPEKENVPIKTKLNLLEEQFSSELNQKTRKMSPVVFGTFWMHKGSPPEGNIFQDLQLDRLQYFPWTACPIEIEEEEDKKADAAVDQEPQSQLKKSRVKVAFPTEEVPHLIKIIHGSPQNSDHLARKFLTYWQSEKTQDGRTLTKKCVLNKIKELASWQASQDRKKMCWQVPRETQKEFGAEVEEEPAEKKPQKCYIWKFIKKGDKTTGLPSPVNQEPEVVVLES